MTFLLDILTNFDMFLYNWLHNNPQCFDLCFLILNIGNKKYGLRSILKKYPGRRDRNFSSLGVKKGVGVLTAVYNKFPTTRLNTATLSDSVPSIDTVGVSISINGFSKAILVVYIAPDTFFFDFDHYFKMLFTTYQLQYYETSKTL
jgi:hypothetical protein